MNIKIVNKDDVLVWLEEDELSVRLKSSKEGIVLTEVSVYKNTGNLYVHRVGVFNPGNFIVKD